MLVATTIAQLREQTDDLRSQGRTVGLVPTMGYLHVGHRSLMDRAVSEGNALVVTIFVNPLQFGPSEDLAKYPRDLEADLEMARSAGAELVFAPTTDEMYPRPVVTTVTVGEVSQGMEGASRATHFAGVATVVSKLFNIVGPCAAYFGEKDYQQLAVIRRMVSDLNFNVSVVGCPTVRESDGLAKSSRNVYLTDDERAAAPVLNRALRTGADLIAKGETDADEVRRVMSSMIIAEPLGDLDYVEVADMDTLEPQRVANERSRLFGAVRFGSARLIDNVGVGADSGEQGTRHPA